MVDAPPGYSMIKPLYKIGDNVSFLGHYCIIMNFEPDARVLLAYNDSSGIIRTLSAPVSVL